jgi:hypothetical protein
MQRLLLGPVASTVELELRHVGDKVTYNVCIHLQLTITHRRLLRCSVRESHLFRCSYSDR